MAAPVSIIIPAFNELHYCRQCVASVLRNTPPPYKLILVDNGSTDGVGEFFDCVPGARVIHAAGNRGFAGGVNLGLVEAEGHALLLNSDTLVPAGWLERLAAPLVRDPGLGMTGPRSNCVSGPQQIDGLSLESLEAIEAFARDLAERNRGRVTEVERLVGFCLLIRDSVLEEVGLFDESFGLGNFEDDDYCLRVLAAGYRLAVAEDCFVFHYGSRTFAGMDLTGDRWHELMERNRRRLLEKWAVRDPEAVRRASELNAEARKALEARRMAKALGLLLDAIRIDPVSAVHRNDLGAVLWALGERERACREFQHALRLDPDHPDARANLEIASRS